MEAHPVVLGDEMVGHIGELEERMQPGGRGCLWHLSDKMVRNANEFQDCIKRSLQDLKTLAIVYWTQG